MKNIIKLDSHMPRGYTYIGWLNSNHKYASYDFSDDFEAVDQNMITSALDRSTIIESVDKDNTPFSDWKYPDQVIAIECSYHCDIYCMPVSKNVILTVLGDKSLGHSVETSADLRSTINSENKVNIIPKEDTPFRKHISMV